MNDFSQRLAQVINHYHLTHAAFAEKMGIQKSSVSHLLSGRNKPNFDFIARFPEVFPEINLQWLLTGKGNMLNGVQQETKKTQQTAVVHEYVEKSSNELNEIIKVFADGTFEVLKKRQ